MSVEAFFAFARERHAIYLRRKYNIFSPQMALAASAWTKDPILGKYRFTNVFRELDKTTVWLRENVRERYALGPEYLLAATVIFRWFNRIATGEAIFSQGFLPLTTVAGYCSFDAYMRTGDIGQLRAPILSYCGKGPYVTGSYIIKTPDGKSKLDGVLWCIEQFMKTGPKAAPTLPRWTLREAWEWLKEYPYMGPFMAYEVVTDLRWTPLMDKAGDIMTWANPGPGAKRGINRVRGADKDANISREQQIYEMQQLLERSTEGNNWPNPRVPPTIHGLPGSVVSRTNEPSDWPAWEMREVEHTLCEFDKYERARRGEGRPRGTWP
jgi:hypothetical protein